MYKVGFMGDFMKKRILSAALGLILGLVIFSVPVSGEDTVSDVTEASSVITENNKQKEDITLSPLLILTLVGLCTAGIIVTVKFTKMKF